MIKQETGANNGVYYPTNTTNGITDIEYLQQDHNVICASNHECNVFWYKMHDPINPYDANSEIVKLIDDSNPYSVLTTDVFSLQYSEGCCSWSTGDNSGTSCAEVYFIYN